MVFQKYELISPTGYAPQMVKTAQKLQLGKDVALVDPTDE